MNGVALQRENIAFIAGDAACFVISARCVDGRDEVWTQGEKAVDQIVIALSLDLDCRVRGHTRQHCQVGIGELPQLQGRINELGSATVTRSSVVVGRPEPRSRATPMIDGTPEVSTSGM